MLLPMYKKIVLLFVALRAAASMLNVAAVSDIPLVPKHIISVLTFETVGPNAIAN